MIKGWPLADAAAFISYQRSDSEIVDRLVERLRTNGIRVWLDRDDIAPGQRWKDAVRKAIRSGTAFIACFSASLETRDRSYMYEELTQAIDEIRARPTERAWFFAVTLDNTAVPDRAIGAGETLRDLQSIDLHKNFDEGCTRLVAAITALS